MCKKDVQAKEDFLRKGKYFCVESPLCLHEAGKEGYLKQKKVKQVFGCSENQRCQHAKEWKLLKGEENENNYFWVEIPPSLQEAGSEVVFS